MHLLFTNPAGPSSFQRKYSKIQCRCGHEKVRRCRAGALQDWSEFVLLNLCFCSQQQCKEQKQTHTHTHTRAHKHLSGSQWYSLIHTNTRGHRGQRGCVAGSPVSVLLYVVLRCVGTVEEARVQRLPLFSSGEHARQRAQAHLFLLLSPLLVLQIF